MAPSAQPRQPGSDDGDLLKYVVVVWRRRRLIACLCGATVTLTMATCLLLPRIYESTATVISPQEGSLEFSKLLAIGGMGAAEAIGGFSLPSLTPHRDLFVSLLESRTLREQIVDELHLADHYDVEKTHHAERLLYKRTHISVSKEGVIAVRVEDRDPEMAPRIANSYVATLDRRLASYSIGDASRQREFLEKRLETTEGELRLAEEAQREFQEKHKLVAIEEQIKGSAEAASELRTRIALLETQLEMWRSYVAEENPEFRKLETLLHENKRQLAKLQYGKGLVLPAETVPPPRPPSPDDTDGIQADRTQADRTQADRTQDERREIHVAFSAIPELGLELARLTRDVVTKNKVYALLVAELEKAKISQSRDMPVVQVLDTAVPPTRKSKPRTLINMILAGSLSLFLATILAFVLEYWKLLQRQLELEQEAGRQGRPEATDLAKLDLRNDDAPAVSEPPPRRRRRSTKRKRVRQPVISDQ